jgi:hypothetical protein
MAREKADHTLGGTALVQEADLRLAGHPAGVSATRRHFLAAAQAPRRNPVENTCARGRVEQVVEFPPGVGRQVRPHRRGAARQCRGRRQARGGAERRVGSGGELLCLGGAPDGSRRLPDQSSPARSLFQSRQILGHCLTRSVRNSPLRYPRNLIHDRRSSPKSGTADPTIQVRETIGGGVGPVNGGRGREYEGPASPAPHLAKARTGK